MNQDASNYEKTFTTEYLNAFVIPSGSGAQGGRQEFTVH